LRNAPTAVHLPSDVCFTTAIHATPCMQASQSPQFGGYFLLQTLAITSHAA
jgi:hypothetical protein